MPLQFIKTAKSSDASSSSPMCVRLQFPWIRQVPLQNVNHYFHDDACTTTVDLEDPVDVKFLDVTPNIYGVCTTTKCV